MKTSSITNYNQTNFKSTSAEIKKADSIMRRIRIRFPMYSETYLNSYKSVKKNKELKALLSKMGLLIDELRSEVFFSRPKDEFFKIMDYAHDYKVGNCNESMMLTRAVLKANGYDNVVGCALYGFNAKKNRIVDLDHCFCAINLDFPKNKVIDFENITRRDLVQPNNKSIIVDTWAGKVGFAKTLLPEYRGNIPLMNKPADVHKLFLLPIETNEVPKEVLDFIAPTPISPSISPIASKKTESWKDKVFKFLTKILY